MKKIQMVDLTGQYEKIREEVNAGIQEVIDTTAFIKAGKVVEFQANLEKYLGVKNVIPVGNGTDALQIALMALDLQPGDEVITPSFTFIATAEVVALMKFKPVFVDVDYSTFNIDIESLKNAITPKTKAIIPVHLFGQNANMEELMQVAKEHNLYVIEDGCQSIGAQYTFADGTTKMSGCIGNIGCTSFFPSKNLGCFGDGGAIFTNDDELAKKIRTIANHGMEVRYYHEYVGVNSRLDSMQAAVLDVKLKHLDTYSAARQKAAAYYDNAFKNIECLTIPARDEKTTHVFHQYTLKLKGKDRAKLIAALNEKGIPAMIYYPVPLHLQKPYRDERTPEGSLPISEQLSREVFSLPMHTELTEDQLEYITKNVIATLAEI